jgi:hypothetical protein
MFSINAGTSHTHTCLAPLLATFFGEFKLVFALSLVVLRGRHVFSSLKNMNSDYAPESVRNKLDSKICFPHYECLNEL